MLNFPDTYLMMFGALVIISLSIFYFYKRTSNEKIHLLNKQVKAAENLAFSGTGDGRMLPEKAEPDKKLRLGDLSYMEGKPRSELFRDEPQPAPTVNHLFKLYTEQISKYQEQTQNRAMSSFVFAIIAMFAGIIFIFWGGSYILIEKTWEATLAGSTISTIGGVVSAYITKTFLNVHELSIRQLNRYFQQPVINDHIVMAQRLADRLPNEEARQKAYENIIHSVTKLIQKDADESLPAPGKNNG